MLWICRRRTRGTSAEFCLFRLRNLRRSGSGTRSAAQRMMMCTYLRFAVFKVIVDCKQL